MLIHARQRVENGAFAHIRVPRKGNGAHCRLAVGRGEVPAAAVSIHIVIRTFPAPRAARKLHVGEKCPRPLFAVYTIMLFVPCARRHIRGSNCLECHKLMVPTGVGFDYNGIKDV